MRNYRGRHMRADLVAGLTVAVVAVPQSMALALVTGLPIQVGLYASIVPTIIASLWGSSAHLITGPTTAISLVVFTSLSELAAPGTSKYLELAFVLSLMVGLILGHRVRQPPGQAGASCSTPRASFPARI